jgi:hypothetical protein
MNHCGGCGGVDGDVCSAPAHGTARCVGGICDFVCDDWYVVEDSTCVALRPATCQDVADYDPSAPDGDYTLYVASDSSRPWTARCVDMGSTPLEYLPLQETGADVNFSQYTSGDGAPGTDVRTNYVLLRFDPVTLVVDIGDQRFTTSTGHLDHGGEDVFSMPYGVAMSCDQRPSGVANINLVGTPFMVSDSFCQAGWEPQGSATPSAGGQVYDITGGGYCGWVAPDPCPHNPFNTTGGFILELAYIDP